MVLVHISAQRGGPAVRAPEVPVDAPRGGLYVPRPRSGPVRPRSLVLLGVAAVLGCATASRPPSSAAVPEPRRVASGAERATALTEPVSLVFAWRLNESGSRVRGRGVARLAPPYRARLDLFTENGETAAVAALVDDELRLPPGMDRRLIPPPPLLWASLGVFHPGAAADLLDGYEGDDGRVVLRYRTSEGGELRLHLRGEQVRGAERVRDGHVTERVRVEGSAEVAPFPRESRYRDLAAFRELTVTLESVERVESHPEEIWRPGR